MSVSIISSIKQFMSYRDCNKESSFFQIIVPFALLLFSGQVAKRNTAVSGVEVWLKLIVTRHCFYTSSMSSHLAYKTASFPKECRIFFSNMQEFNLCHSRCKKCFVESQKMTIFVVVLKVYIIWNTCKIIFFFCSQLDFMSSNWH